MDCLAPSADFGVALSAAAVGEEMNKRTRKSSRKRCQNRVGRCLKQQPTPLTKGITPNRAAIKCFLAIKRGVIGKCVRDEARKKRRKNQVQLRRNLRIIQRQMRRALRLLER